MRALTALFYTICSLLLLGSCDNSGFQDAETSHDGATGVIPPTDDPSGQNTPPPYSSDGVSSGSIFEDGNRGDFSSDTQVLFVNEWTYGGKYPVDFLFVIDNSASMEDILDKVNRGFASISLSPELFADDSKLAVMSTMIGQLPWEGGNLSEPSSHISAYRNIALEPGFLSLVDYDAFQRYVQGDVPEHLKDRWALEPCSQKWFTPTAVHPNLGHSCFEAATQISATALNTEAGIKAFEQLLTKNPSGGVFRDKAIVNVVFVSDTHDPGAKVGEQYFNSRLGYGQLKELVSQSHTVVDLKFHAIAPDKVQCDSSSVGEGLWNHSYYKLATSSRGYTADSCQVEDYRDLLSEIIAHGQIASPVFDLDLNASQVQTVKVDGQVTGDFIFDETAKTVTIDNLDPYRTSHIQIYYTVD